MPTPVDNPMAGLARDVCRPWDPETLSDIPTSMAKGSHNRLPYPTETRLDTRVFHSVIVPEVTPGLYFFFCLTFIVMLFGLCPSGVRLILQYAVVTQCSRTTNPWDVAFVL
jgi:hypothetical protein